MRALGFLLTCSLAACGGQLNVGNDPMNEGGSSAVSGSSSTAAASGTAQAGYGGNGPGAGARGGMDAAGGKNSGAGGGPTMASGGVSGNDPGQGGVSMGAYGGVAPSYGGVMPAYGGKDTGNGSGGIGMGGMVAASGAPPIPTWPTPDDVTETPEVTGSWDGYTEDFLFRPLDRYRIEIAGVTEAGIIRGTVWFGEDKLEAPTDPEQAYPGASEGDGGKGAIGLIFQLYPGATYTIVDGVQRDDVVRFQVMTSEVMRPWCELQTPFALEDGRYSCLPAEGFSWNQMTCTVRTQSGQEYTFGQAKCTQCLTCVCDASECTADQREQTAFDLKLSGDELTGTVGSSPIRLKRVE